ncbi:MAG: sugar phosphate isomerase/epimerase [Anaerolineae bacterium]|jgi:sugar phosphate isomerase/epimerase|nr:sugar phosphate isomerase/epimerase [Anaerolineae bacterium]
MTRIGIQISSVREYLQTPEDVLASFRKVSRIGYRIIQVQWISPAVPAEFVRDALHETALTCVGTQDYYDVVTANLDGFIRMNDLWGSANVCVSGIPKRCRSYEGCLAFAEECNRLSQVLERQGKVLSFHPRAVDVLDFNGCNSLEVLLEHTRPELQFVLDVWQLVKAGLDPVVWIHKVTGRHDLIHFKDGIRTPDGNDALMPTGQGSIAWGPIFRACQEAGVKYGFAEQESWQKDPFECLRESYDFIVTHGIGR